MESGPRDESASRWLLEGQKVNLPPHDLLPVQDWHPWQLAMRDARELLGGAALIRARCASVAYGHERIHVLVDFTCCGERWWCFADPGVNTQVTSPGVSRMAARIAVRELERVVLDHIRSCNPPRQV